MNYFNSKLIPMSVGAMLSSVSALASPPINQHPIVDLKTLSDKAVVNSFDAAFQYAMSRKATKSQMKSLYDEGLGKSTFLWASRDIEKTDLASIDSQNHMTYMADYYVGVLGGVRANSGHMNAAVMSNMHDLGKGPIIAKYRQQVSGIEVFNREYNIMMDRNYNLVASSGYFSQAHVSEKDTSALSNFGYPESAIQSAFDDLSNGTAKVTLSHLGKEGKYDIYQGENSGNQYTVIGSPRAKSVYFDTPNGLIAAYYVEVGMSFREGVDSELYGYVIDATTGDVLFKNNMVAQESSFTYRAYISEEGVPFDSPHGDVIPALVPDQDPTALLEAPLVTLPYSEGFSQQDPWLADDAEITSGNNVFSYADIVSPQGFTDGDITAAVTSERTFGYHLVDPENASSPEDINAAIVNLFVVNNYLHDYYYDYGFDEASGNAQNDNFDRGGLGDDALFVEAQDFSGLNNANMFTPADGANPRMQMFLFNSKDAAGEFKDSSFDNGIVAHEFGHYIQNRLIGNASGLSNLQGRAMGEGWADFHSLLLLVRAEDQDLPGNDEYQTPYANTSFVRDFFRGIRRAPYTPNKNINPLTFQHITNGAEPPGLPETSTIFPHPPGEIWATVLWDVYVRLINTHGFAEAKDRMSGYIVAGYKMTPVRPTYIEARDAILSVMFATDEGDFDIALSAFANRGMGLGAVAPDRDSRSLDGVVESDLTELSSYTASEFFVNPTFDGVELGFCSNDGVLDVGETGTISFDVFNNGSERLSGVTAQLLIVDDNGDPIDDQSVVTISNDGLIELEELTPFESTSVGPVLITLNSAEVAETMNFRVTFPELEPGDSIVEANDLTFTTQVNFAVVPRAVEGNSTTDDMENDTTLLNWTENVLNGGDRAIGSRELDRVETAFFQKNNPGLELGEQTQLIRNHDFTSDIAYETQSFTVGDEGDFEVSFFHFYDIERRFDGGVVEVSVDGEDWTDVTNVGGVFDVGYPDIQTVFGRSAFTGLISNNAPNSVGGSMERISFGQSLNGQNVRFRFRIINDVIIGRRGWFIDNVNFTNVASPVFFDVAPGDNVDCDNSALRLSIDDIDAEFSEGQVGEVSATATDRNANPDDITYLWEQTAGPTALLENANTSTLSFTLSGITQDENLTFQVTVTDGVDVVSEVITVPVINNNPPEVSLSNSEVVVVESQIGQLLAEVEDEDSALEDITYLWEQTEGPEAELEGTTTASLSFSLSDISADTNLTFRLTVSDGVEETSITNTVLVTNNQLPTVTLSSSNLTVDESQRGTFSATVQDPDTEQENITFLWEQIEGPSVALSGTTTANLNFTAGEVSSDTNLAFRLTVSDGVDTVTVEARATVLNTSSGGGSFGLAGLLAILLTLYRRKKLSH